LKLLNFFKTLSPDRIQLLKEKTGIEKENPLDFYISFSAFLEKMLSFYLKDLTSAQSLVFFHAVLKDGFELNYLEKYETYDNLQEGLKELENKGLVYSLKSIQKVKPSVKVFIYPEISEIIQKRFNILSFKDLALFIQTMKGQAANQKYQDMPHEMFFFLFSYGGICRQEFLIQQFGEPAVHYFLEEKLLTESLVLIELENGFSLTPCYQLDSAKIIPNPLNFIRNISYNTRIFNDIIKLIYFITKEDILITQKGKINKKHYERLLNEFESETVLWFLIRFLSTHQFVKTDRKDSYIYLTKKGTLFFKQSIQEVYDKILNTDTFIQEIFELVKKMTGFDFTIADLSLAYLKERFQKEPDLLLSREFRRNILKGIEILNYMGILVKKFTAEGFAVYSFNAQYKNLTNDLASPKKPLVPAPSMEITVYPQELDLQTSYILNIFMEIVNFSDIFVYKMTPQSIKRALYFGFSIDLLLATLKNKSRIELPENIVSNVERWSEQFQKGKISHQVILEAKKETLDKLSLNQEYKYLMINRLNDNFAIVAKEIYAKRILEELSIYLYSEEEKNPFEDEKGEEDSDEGMDLIQK